MTYAPRQYIPANCYPGVNNYRILAFLALLPLPTRHDALRYEFRCAARKLEFKDAKGPEFLIVRVCIKILEELLRSVLCAAQWWRNGETTGRNASVLPQACACSKIRCGCAATSVQGSGVRCSRPVSNIE